MYISIPWRVMLWGISSSCCLHEACQGTCTCSNHARSIHVHIGIYRACYSYPTTLPPEGEGSVSASTGFCFLFALICCWLLVECVLGSAMLSTFKGVHVFLYFKLMCNVYDLPASILLATRFSRSRAEDRMIHNTIISSVGLIGKSDLQKRPSARRFHLVYQWSSSASWSLPQILAATTFKWRLANSRPMFGSVAPGSEIDLSLGCFCHRRPFLGQVWETIAACNMASTATICINIYRNKQI